MLARWDDPRRCPQALAPDSQYQYAHTAAPHTPSPGQLVTIIRQKNAASIYVPLAVCAILNGTLWTIYGFVSRVLGF